MSQKVLVAGVGMIPFQKPGKSDTYDVMGANATNAALQDAGLTFDAIPQAYAGYVFGDSTSGQTALYRVGMTGIPVVNVNNNCSTGATALWLARQAVASGAVECALALGFEQMTRGALSLMWNDRPKPFHEAEDLILARPDGDADAPSAAKFFGAAGADYAKKYGTADSTFARISVKARQHAAKNPYALFKDQLTVEEVLESPHLYGPLTRLQACPPTCGAAAVIVCSEEFAAANHIDASVVIAGMALRTDTPSTFDGNDATRIVGYDMSVAAANAAYEEAGIGPEDAQVVELHDCFTANELIHYESLGLTSEGTAEKFILDGDNTYGGRYVVNPSGGLLSKGHPLGATGLAQATELVWHLRGTAGERQVDGARVAIQQNLGLGGAVVVGVYQKVT
jgi:acetyl-CoA acetyltransferase